MQTHNPLETTLPTHNGTGEQLLEFLSFRLGAEEYGIEILKVQEIREIGRAHV